MSMKSLEADKPSIAKSEATTPHFNVMQLMEDYRGMRAENSHASNAKGAKQPESLSDVAKKSDAHHTSGQLDMGTSFDLYGENAHAPKHASKANHTAQADNIGNVSIKDIQQMSKDAGKHHDIDWDNLPLSPDSSKKPLPFLGIIG